MRGFGITSWLSSLELVAATCRVYTRDPANAVDLDRSSQHQTLSPLVARMVLAQRAGVEEFHRVDIAKSEVISGINDFGVWTSLLEDSTNNRHIFYLLRDVPDKNAILSVSSEFRSFEVSAAPNANVFEQLLADMSAQSKAVRATPRDETRVDYTAFPKNASIEIRLRTAEQFTAEVTREFLNESVTIIAISSEHEEPKQEADWGTYEMPHVSTRLQKRERIVSEAPLEFEEMAFGKAVSHEINTMTKNGTVKGILPSCFSSKRDCESATQDCSGRGSCYLKFSKPDAADEAPNKHCYTCACRPDVIDNDDGSTLTTRWGGPACQKKDVSMQFWLIALFTVGLVSLVSFAVGTIWSMGNEELPSVIGAGVSGPIKR